jgi:hypothetical protein
MSIEPVKRLGYIGVASYQSATEAGAERVKALKEAGITEHSLFHCDDLGRYKAVSFVTETFKLLDGERRYEVRDQTGKVTASSKVETKVPGEAEVIYAALVMNGKHVVTGSFRKATCRAINDVIKSGNTTSFHLRAAQAAGKRYPMTYQESCPDAKGKPDPADVDLGLAWVKSKA